jgi:hypothetical protein
VASEKVVDMGEEPQGTEAGVAAESDYLLHFIARGG